MAMPQNIVEAYAKASKTAELNPKMRLDAYDEVISFCENDQKCSLENSLKRDMLLFWAYDNVAQSNMDAKRYHEALEVWQKAGKLIRSPQARIDLGTKMLEAADKSHLSIPQKAQKIVEITHYLQEAYHEIGDEPNFERIKRLNDVATYLLGGSKSKH